MFLRLNFSPSNAVDKKQQKIPVLTISISWNTETVWARRSLTPSGFHSWIETSENIIVLGQKWIFLRILLHLNSEHEEGEELWAQVLVLKLSQSSLVSEKFPRPVRDKIEACMIRDSTAGPVKTVLSSKLKLNCVMQFPARVQLSASISLPPGIPSVVHVAILFHASSWIIRKSEQ